MANDDDRLNLVQRLAEKQARKDDRPLSERAADKLADASPPAPTPSAQNAVVPPATPAASPSVDTASKYSSAKTPKSTDSAKGGAAKNNYFDIDLPRLQLAGYITPNAQETRLGEEYRTIKRPLLLKAFGAEKSRIPNGNVVLVTSARPGEGKTFTALNLAMSIATERDLHVLLIDADVYKHELCSRLGVPNDHGLVDLLIDESIDVPDVMIRTNIANLTVLPAGTRHPSSPELLASQRMAAFMQDLGARYPDRIIIIDAPPILASSEPGVLALLVGQIIMVVESGKTDRNTLEQSLALISNCPNINFVLNKSANTFGSGQYSAYTYYDEYRNFS
ncbi:MAG: AAA family ATPase [Rhodospirillaceae bacterium]|jgi:protein-tyrosine kinase|nr:AAA family ATPase [Rhodospirillaceae bacterium]MBT5666529.1 AAA family ATPase [Rhodospirillaceae bacterium]